jgi:phenylacetate-CoA ligase
MREFTTMEKLSLLFQFLTRYPNAMRLSKLDQEQMKAHQFSTIKRLLDIAYYHTDFYRHKYNAVGVHPNDIKTWEDFKQLPTITKDELITCSSEFVDKRVKNNYLIFSKSSGSTGKFVSVQLDAHYFNAQAIQVIRMLKELNPGYSPLDKELLVYTSPYPFSSIGGFYRTVYLNNLLSEREILRKILQVRPAIISIYPSILRTIVDRHEIHYRDLGIETIITNSEHSTQSERDYFAKLFGCSVFDEFSSEELGAIAYQCVEKQYHLVQDCSYIELLSANTDKEANPGQPGEIVGTCLINTVAPIIRYRQSDLAILATNPCDCGKTTPVLQTIVGRKNSSFKRPDGIEIPSGRILDWTYSLVLKLELSIREFQIIQRTLTLIEVNLVVSGNYKPEFDNSKLIYHFKLTFGAEFEVVVNIVPSIPRTESGKYIPIQSLI